MNYIGRRIYYNPSDGMVIFHLGETLGNFVERPSVEEDLLIQEQLNNYTLDDLGVSIDYIDLEYGVYQEEFDTCRTFRVNPETRSIEFSYKEGIYQKPLTEQLSELEARTKATEDMILALLGGS